MFLQYMIIFIGISSMIIAGFTIYYGTRGYISSKVKR